jgi:SAM-dependent methyltransferase
MVKITKPKTAQSSSNTNYAGGDELWAAERYLINYNNDLISKLTKANIKSQKVLEFGAGIGTLANLWNISTTIKPECLEIDSKQRLIIEQRGFHCYSSLDSVENKFDVIYTSNVLEHIEDDSSILKQLNTKLNTGGKLVIYVPAFQALYSELDEKVGHYRRYEKQELLKKLNSAGFRVDKFYYSDSIGFFAWLYVKLRGYNPEKSDGTSMKIYDKYIFPLSKILDEIGCKFIFGKNILVYAQKI